MKQRIILPTRQLLCMCEVPERLIQKRHDKMLDYDNAQYKLDKTKDPTRTRIVSLVHFSMIVPCKNFSYCEHFL